MKKILAMIFVVAMLLTAFAGCGGDDKKPADSSSSTSSTSSTVVSDSILSKEDVKFVDGDEAVYRVVRADGDSEITTLASKVFTQYKKSMNTKPKNVLDSEDGTDVYEILVGTTNRAESSQAMEYLIGTGAGRYEDYIICTIGKKIVINAVTKAGLESAVDYFTANFLKADGVAGGILYIGATAGDFKDIPINGVNIGRFKMIIDGTSRSYLIQTEAEKISALIKSTTGFLVELENDLDTTESEYEIIIGNANREGTPAQSSFNPDDYEIRISGKKVYLVGGSTYAVQVAVTEFAKMLEKGSVTDADSTTGSYTATVAGYDSATYYKYVWGDEFNTGKLDTTKWVMPDGQKYWDDTGRTFIVDETTVTFSNDTMTMLVFRDDDGNYYQPFGIKSEGKFTFNKGYMELRARIPDGVGVYSSFWGTGGGLEIDVFENLGVAHKLQANVHWWRSEDEGGHTSCDGVVSDRYIRLEEDMAARFHTVGLFWNDTEISFYCDGIQYYTQAATEFEFDKFINIQVCVNAGWEGRTPPGADVKWPLEYEVDYVRLYQIDGQSFKTAS